MKWYLEVLNKYAVFKGRARRKEYWMFVLINYVIGFLLGLIEGIIGTTPAQNGWSILGLIYSLAVFIPSIAVAVRRMHDNNLSGWIMLVPFFNVILLFTKGTDGDNDYGPDPKAVSQPVENLELPV